MTKTTHPTPLRFPVHLRKMWSGTEVQAWLDEQFSQKNDAPSANSSFARYRAWQANAAQNPTIEQQEEQKDWPTLAAWLDRRRTYPLVSIDGKVAGDIADLITALYGKAGSGDTSPNDPVRRFEAPGEGELLLLANLHGIEVGLDGQITASEKDAILKFAKDLINRYGAQA